MKRLITIVVGLLLTAATMAQTPLEAQVVDNVNVRAGAGQNFTRLAQLAAGQGVLVEARNSIGNWVLVRTSDEATRGWVASRYVRWDADVALAALSISDEVIGSSAPQTAASEAQSSAPAADGQTTTTLNVRRGPGTTFSIITQVGPGTRFSVEARSAASDWLLINTGAVRGWAAARFTRLSRSLDDVAESAEVIGAAPAAASGGVPLTESDAAIVQRLQNTPVVPGISANAVAIYQRGVARGRNPHYFLKVGDSNSESLAYLGLFGTGAYNLGPYRALQPTIDFFMRSGNSWLDLTQAAQSGNLTTTLIDPIFAQPGRCAEGESPLRCEIRLKNPSVAIIYLGTADNQLLDTGTYTSALRQIVQDCFDEGVLPIVTTMPSRPHPQRPQSYALSFNNAILQVASEFDIPVLNMWAATQSLPDNGLQGDLLHFTITPNYRFIDLRGDERVTGYTAWNLGALQILDAVRRAVGG
jgi:uncharacterized protein YraI